MKAPKERSQPCRLQGFIWEDPRRPGGRVNYEDTSGKLTLFTNRCIIRNKPTAYCHLLSKSRRSRGRDERCACSPNNGEPKDGSSFLALAPYELRSNGTFVALSWPDNSATNKVLDASSIAMFAPSYLPRLSL